MFQDAFVKLDRLACETALEDINPGMEGSPFDPATVTIMAHDLPFYPGWQLLELSDHSAVPIKHRTVVHKAGQAVFLDGTNGPIYSLNETAPLTLDDRNVLTYARFFFSYVRGRHGRFLIVDNVDDIAWREELPAAARKAMGQMIEPLRLSSYDAETGYHLTGQMIFRDGLFRAQIHVEPKKGFVTLDNEELVIEDMPVLDDTLRQ